MGEVINLRRFRKDKTRDEAQKQAQANRALHGRSKSEKQRTAAESEAACRHVEGHRLDKPADDGARET